MIEMANASGLLLAGGELGNDPMKASTVGTGQLILRAVSLGATRVIVGCGGSATTDGGAGALESSAHLKRSEASSSSPPAT